MIEIPDNKRLLFETEAVIRETHNILVRLGNLKERDEKTFVEGRRAIRDSLNVLRKVRRLPTFELPVTYMTDRP